MAGRSATQESPHDDAVRGLESIYIEKGFTTWSNPGAEKNKEFNERYPDVIVQTTGGGYYLFEVETADSVTQAEAESQWVDYDSVWTSAWYLAVPSGQKSEAASLLAENSIKHCTIVTWRKDENGTHTFWGLPGL